MQTRREPGVIVGLIAIVIVVSLLVIGSFQNCSEPVYGRDGTVVEPRVCEL